MGQHFIYDNDTKLKIFFGNNYFTDEELMRYAEYIYKSMEMNIPDIINLAQIFNGTYYENRKLNNDSIEKQKNKLYS